MKRKLKKFIARLFGISAICDAFENAFENSKNRGWDYFYVFIDLHQTVLYPDYDKKFVSDFYPHAIQALQTMSNRPDMKLIIYTCSHPEEIEEYKTLFEINGIEISYVNENPEVVGTNYGDFTKKPYMNVLLEDKAGFDAEEDWRKIIKMLNKYPNDYLTK